VLIRTARDAPDDFGQQLCDWGAPAVTAIDLASGRSTLLAAEAADRVPGTLSRDGRFAAFDGVAAADGSVASIVVDADTGRPALEIEDSPGVRGLSRDGALLLVGDRPLQVYDVASGVTESIADLGGAGGDIIGASFSPTDDTVYGTALDAGLRRWVGRDGQDAGTWPAVGSGRPSISADGTKILVSGGSNPEAVLIDRSPRGDLGGATTCPGWVPSTGLQVAGNYAALLVDCSGGAAADNRAYVIDLATQRPLYDLPQTGLQTLSISPDARSFVVQTFEPPLTGPMVIRDLTTGDRGRAGWLCTLTRISSMALASAGAPGL
jgi:hypothetical protein